MFFLPFSAKHALYQLRDVTQYILALGGLAVSNPGNQYLLSMCPLKLLRLWPTTTYSCTCFKVTISIFFHTRVRVEQ